MVFRTMIHRVHRLELVSQRTIFDKTKCSERRSLVFKSGPMDRSRWIVIGI